MSEKDESERKSNVLSPLHQVAAGYVDPFRPVDESADHRRITDGILHWQNRPKVYPFREKSQKTGNSLKEDDKTVSSYVSEFVQKPLSVRKFRPSSINRRNNPHPNHAFHFDHILNQGIPVVRTRMTLEEFYRKPTESPYLSNTHRTYRRYKPTEIDRAKPLQQVAESATGIVPELNKPEVDPAEANLFPVIPRNSRLTADRAHELTNSVIKPRRNKFQPHLPGVTSSVSGSFFSGASDSFHEKPSLKPCSGHPDSLKATSWDGAPSENARTRSRVFGRKRSDKSKTEEAAQAVVPALAPPTSKSLMFKEYSQFPKYAPQMLQEYYSGKDKRHISRPYVY